MYNVLISLLELPIVKEFTYNLYVQNNLILRYYILRIYLLNNFFFNSTMRNTHIHFQTTVNTENATLQISTFPSFIVD